MLDDDVVALVLIGDGELVQQIVGRLPHLHHPANSLTAPRGTWMDLWAAQSWKSCSTIGQDNLDDDLPSCMHWLECSDVIYCIEGGRWCG